MLDPRVQAGMIANWARNGAEPMKSGAVKGRSLWDDARAACSATARPWRASSCWRCSSLPGAVRAAPDPFRL